jgi:uncharacterized membrane protein YbhN (UPF0104 family)
MADRRSFGLALRTAASLVMLAVLVPRVQLRSLFPAWDLTTAAWLVAALTATAAGLVAAAARWQAMLAVLDHAAPLPHLVHHYLAGMFVGNFLPSTIGGDVLRVKRLSGEVGDGAAAFASVLLERLTGMFVLPVLVLAGLAANPGLRQLGPATALATVLSVGTLLLLVAILVTVGHPRLGGRLTGTSGWRQLAGAVHLGAARIRRHPRPASRVLAAAFTYQLLFVLAAFFAARALDLHHVGLTAVLTFVPAVAIAQTIPVSIGGFGLREGALVLFLDPLEVTAGRAIALGLLLYGLNLLVSLFGAPSFAVGSRRVAA